MTDITKGRRAKIADGLLAAMEALSKVEGVDCSIELASLNAKFRSCFEISTNPKCKGVEFANQLSDSQLAIAIAQLDPNLELVVSEGKPNIPLYRYLQLHRPFIFQRAERLRGRGVTPIKFQITGADNGETSL